MAGPSHLWSKTKSKRSTSSGKLYGKLDDYQRHAVDFALRKKTAALFFEQGTGKTWIALGVLEGLLAETFEGLFVVPLANYDTTWVRTIKEQLPQVSLCRTLEELKAAPFPRLLLIHYEVLPGIVAKLRKRKFSLIAFDESHRLKARGTAASRSAGRLKNSAEYKLILTGTPMDSQPMDLFGQFRFLNPRLLGESWKDFAADYVIEKKIDLSKYKPGSHRWKRMLMISRMKKPKFDFSKIDEFTRALATCSLRVGKEVLDLPPLEIIPVEGELHGAQRRLYDRLAKNWSADGITAENKAVLELKLHQVVGGFVPDDEGFIVETGDAKLALLNRALARCGNSPVVIWAEYLEELEMLREELGRRYDRVEVIRGGVKPAKRAAIVDDFQAGKVDILICQIKTGGVGLDLFRACRGILYSFRHSFIVFDQTLSRLHRRGQTELVRIFLLIAKNTVDVSIYSSILSKGQRTARVVNPLRREQWPSKRKSTSTISTPSARTSGSSRPRFASCSGRPRSAKPARATAGTRRPTTRPS